MFLKNSHPGQPEAASRYILKQFQIHANIYPIHELNYMIIDSPTFILS
jgi:hypothetical protein